MTKNRLAMTNGENQLERRLWRVAAWLTFMAYGVEFGLIALVNLLVPSASSSHITARELLIGKLPYWTFGLAFTILAATCLGLSAHASRTTGRELPQDIGHGLRRTWIGDGIPGAGSMTWGLVWVTLLVSAGATTLAEEQGLLPSAAFTWPTFDMGTHMAMGFLAGTGEEPIVLVLPVLLWQQRRGRQLDLPAVGFLTVLVVARMFYHLYYGWGSLALLPWAIVMVIAYWRWRSSWGLIVGHFLYYVNHLPWQPEIYYVMVAIGLALIFLGGIRMRNYSHSTSK